jgi:hypothetical protein
MKHFMLFEDFFEINEDLNPVSQKDLQKLGDGFENDEEIAVAIARSGFIRLRDRSSADYVFMDPSRDVKYVSTIAGYVRYLDPNAIFWRTENR